jgi:hypothetical protein
MKREKLTSIICSLTSSSYDDYHNVQETIVDDFYGTIYEVSLKKTEGVLKEFTIKDMGISQKEKRAS